MDIEAIRRQFPVTRKAIYLNTGFSGPSHDAVNNAVIEALQFEAIEGPTSPPVLERHRTERQAGRAAFAEMLGATPEEVVLTDNTTRGINIVLSGLPWDEGDELITDNLEHGSGLVPPYHLRYRLDVNVKVAQLDPHDSEGMLVQRFEDAITPRTRLIILSHIMYATGLRMPLAEVNRMAHHHNVQVLVDGAQSMGQIRLDMRETESDYYAVPGHKWLLGPEGVGALFIRRDLLAGVTPVAVGGRAALSYDPQGNYEPKLDAVEKFEVSTTSVPLLCGARAAINYLQALGMPEVEGRWQMLAEYLRTNLRGIAGVKVTSPPAGPTACGLVTFTVAGWEPTKLVEQLWQQEQIVMRSVSYPPGLRASVDFFNTEEELDHLVDAVRQAVKGGSPE